jgi:hypothetical protein
MGADVVMERSGDASPRSKASGLALFIVAASFLFGQAGELLEPLPIPALFAPPVLVALLVMLC